MQDNTHIGDTIRIRRPPKVRTNALGHSIWMPDVETIELEVANDDAAGFEPYDTAAGGEWSGTIRKFFATP